MPSNPDPLLTIGLLFFSVVLFLTISIVYKRIEQELGATAAMLFLCLLLGISAFLYFGSL